MKSFIQFILPLLACFLVEAATVIVVWDANPEPDVDRYQVYIGETSRDYIHSILITGATRAEVDGLEPGRVYYIAVTALNTSGLESDYSDEIWYETPEEDGIPEEDSILPVPYSVTVTVLE